MKLNESRLIAQILKLANKIKESSDLSEVKSHADGIISVCNIIDTDNDIPFQVFPADKNAKIQLINNNFEDTDLFNKAKEEQQCGNSDLT